MQVFDWTKEIKEDELRIVTKALDEDKLIVFPTETVYGIAGNALNVEVIDKLFQAKKRDYSKPFSLMLSDINKIKDIAYVSADEEKIYHVYCAIYQETKDSKPWFYDGKIWSHKYLWSKSGGANTKEEAGRAMYTKAENGINYNRMKGVKDSIKQDVKVQLYCAYIKGESNASDDVPGFWNDIRNKSN